MRTSPFREHAASTDFTISFFELRGPVWFKDLTLPFWDLPCPQWTRNTVDYPTSGRRLNGHVVATYDNVFTVTQCARRCQLHGACASYNFLSPLRRCEISSASHVTNPDDVTGSEESQYYTRDAYTIDPVRLSTYLLILNILVARWRSGKISDQ